MQPQEVEEEEEDSPDSPPADLEDPYPGSPMRAEGSPEDDEQMVQAYPRRAGCKVALRGRCSGGARGCGRGGKAAGGAAEPPAGAGSAKASVAAKVATRAAEDTAYAAAAAGTGSSRSRVGPMGRALLE